MLLPDNKVWTQWNDGDSRGLLKATYNADFKTNRGKLRVTKPTIAAYTEDNDASFSGYAHSIVKFDGSFWFISRDPFKTTSGDPTLAASWSQDESAGAPQYGNTVGDAKVWNGRLLVLDNGVSTGDIAANNGSSWDTNWWSSTLSQSTAVIKFIIPASDGNLYVVTTDKVFKVTTALAVTTSGAGTLDLSARTIEFTCGQTNSTRMWLGYADTVDGTGGVIEWDMSATSISPNRTHRLSAPVRCIAIWDDIVVAVLQDGSVKYNAGGGFTEWQNIALPPTDYPLNDTFIHKNGWAVIDDLPHFLINPIQNDQGNNLTGNTRNGLQFPAGIYCLDPEVGFYHRFAVGNGASTQDDYGQPSLTGVGALYALRDNNLTTSKLLCSYVVNDETQTDSSILAYDDFDNGRTTKTYLIYNPIDIQKIPKQIEAVHKKLTSGSSIKAYYRLENEDKVRVDGAWASTTQFNTTDSITGIGDTWIAQVKQGKGAGQFLRVDSTSAATTSVVTFKDANTLASQNDKAVLDFYNYRYMGTIDTTTKDFNSLTFPSAQRGRRVEVMLEITQTSGATEEIDYIDLVI